MFILENFSEFKNKNTFSLNEAMMKNDIGSPAGEYKKGIELAKLLKGKPLETFYKKNALLDIMTKLYYSARSAAGSAEVAKADFDEGFFGVWDRNGKSFWPEDALKGDEEDKVKEMYKEYNAIMGEVFEHAVSAAKSIVAGDSSGYVSSLNKIESIYKKSDKILKTIYSKYTVGTNNSAQPNGVQSAMAAGAEAVESLLSGNLKIEFDLQMDGADKKLKKHFDKIKKVFDKEKAKKKKLKDAKKAKKAK